MDRTTFLIAVFCLIDDWLVGQRVRQRGPAPILHDSEVLTSAHRLILAHRVNYNPSSVWFPCTYGCCKSARVHVPRGSFTCPNTVYPLRGF